MAIYDVSLYEPIHGGWTADSVDVTADSVVHTADGGPLTPATETNDAVVNANFIAADIYEPVARVWTADSVVVTADSTVYTADGGPLEGARDVADATVIAGILRLGAYYRPPAVIGYGYGVLPQLEGEAHGTVGVAGEGVVTLPQISAAGAGVVDDELELLMLLLLAA
jgi:hypothetical protein